MSDTGDEQDVAEILDDDEIDILDFPPDGTLGVDDLLDDDVPAAGDYAPDDVRRRLRREVPERARGDADDLDLVAPAGVIDPDDPFGPDVTGELVGEPAEIDSESGGLVLSDSTGAGHHRGTWPAEEAALHLVDEEDGIVLDDDEPSRP